MENVIVIKDLVKKYKDNIAVDNVSLNIQRGEIYGILGPNGAGKSTLISMICSVLNKTYGEIKVFNKEVNDNYVKQRIGLVPQNLAIYKDYTAYENVKLFGKLYGLRGSELENRIKEVLEFTSLQDVKDKRAKEFSGGMMRRLNIACGIIHNPEILIMDEPTVGIDAQSRNHILEFIKELNKNGTTIIYTSHYMEEIEYICTNIAIIDNGQIIAKGSKEELKSMISNHKVLKICVEGEENIDKSKIKSVNGVKEVTIEDGCIKIKSINEVNNLDSIIAILVKDNVNIKNIGYEEITLETVFLTLTGKKLRD